MDELILPVSRVFTFPRTKPFIDLLACHLRAEHAAADDPLRMARAQVLLPTRRACTSLRAAFLRIGASTSHILPRMQPLGDMDEDALWSESWIGGGSLSEALELPPAMPRGLRHILLARLVAAGGTPDVEQAALLARELAKLLDAMLLAGIGFEGLSELVPGELASHWQKTLDFLEVVRVGWPRLLESQGMMDAIARRNALLFALAAQWEAEPPDYPVIAAGSTGSQPATGALLKTIAGLPRGMVILPGLDMEMPGDEWDELSETHPQWGLKRLLQTLGVERDSVQLLDDARIPESSHPARARLWSNAMQPAQRTAAWGALEVDITAALAGMERMECATPREEARAIALKLRHALEVPGAQAAVVTQDRQLARMVAAEIRRFGVEMDDSAGVSVLQTPPGVFLRLVAEASGSQAPVPLLALLKHPLSTLGMDAAECRRQARLLERELLRGVQQRTGIAGLKRQAGEAVRPLLGALEAAAGPFMHALAQRQLPFERLLRLHMEAAEKIAGDAKLWHGDAGAALADALHDLALHAWHLGAVETRHYPGLLEMLLQPVTVRPSFGAHPRLQCLSPMEARLQHFDVVILAGLNEGSWPQAAEASPWMSRPMQRAFGLPQPEEAVGKSAHDFALLASAREVVLSRSRKTEGTATTPSRWLSRLDTLLAAVHGAPYPWPESPYVHWARHSPPAELPPVVAPAPKPPVAARPQRLSVTEIETWQRDPYAIYARHVLGLVPLKDLDQEPDLSDFGTLVHKALQRFSEKFPKALPDNVEDELRLCAAEALQVLADRPAVMAFWQPRFNAMIGWLAAQERARRVDMTGLQAECKKQMALGAFTLTTRIDRLEMHADGAFSVVDYKTGSVPAEKDIAAGITPQLPLEAAIVQAEGAGQPRDLSYWKLAGERNEEVEISGGDAAALCAAALGRLQELLEAFAEADMPYLACPDAAFAPRYNPYAHLERKEEWEWL